MKYNYKHSGTGARIYNIWDKIKERCYNKNHKFYKNYGGRGITKLVAHFCKCGVSFLQHNM